MTASVIASGHENSERDRGTATGHSDHPGEHAKAAAVTDSGNSRDRSRQSGFGGPLVVRKPPPATPKPLERTQ